MADSSRNLGGKPMDGSKESSSSWFVHCPGCNKNVTRQDALVEEAIMVLGQVWHRKHLVCDMCKVHVVGNIFPSPRDSSMPICVDCHTKTTHPVCAGCDVPLAEVAVELGGRLWHRDCIKCYGCNASLPHGEYYLWNGEICDETCYMTLKHNLQKSDQDVEVM